MKAAIVDRLLSGAVKGAIYENLIAEQLVKNGYGLFYYKKGESEQEIEFLIENDSRVIPVEVKAGRGSTYSLNRFIEKKAIRRSGRDLPHDQCIAVFEQRRSRNRRPGRGFIGIRRGENCGSGQKCR